MPTYYFRYLVDEAKVVLDQGCPFRGDRFLSVKKELINTVDYNLIA